jgi:para-aminobenzoate synthetase/4-amino-4-deoxychorismate lyase
VLARVEADALWTVAALDYELGYCLEPAAAPAPWVTSGDRSVARFWRFERCRSLDAQAAGEWLSAAGALDAAGVGGLSAGIDEDRHAAAIERIRAFIDAGDCYQINFTFPFRFEWFGSPIGLYRRLREQQPVRYGGFVGDARGGIVSLSPELFLERRGAKLTTRPMKGTAPRAQPAEALLRSSKDLAENLMIVDLLRNDLGRIAQPGTVNVDGLFDIEAYPSVWQMVSSISAAVPGVGLRAILGALFPCGSITGAPKIRAMQLISSLESDPRGMYTGSLGWIAPNGDFRLNVAIRTLELNNDYSGKMGIGSGVVADSSTLGEWDECQLKARFLRDCDPGLALIETLRLEEEAYPCLALHLERLRHSAAWLGFPFDASAIQAALSGQLAAGLWRVRLTLNKNGELNVTRSPLQLNPAAQYQVRMAEYPIVSGDPLRRHKTTSRALYDAALATIAHDNRIFDVVFLNERGEVAEGARSNVFVERDGLLLTPPLSSGALPGVLRAALLAEGRAREAVLYASDLASGFWLGNALRGLVRVAGAGV